MPGGRTGRTRGRRRTRVSGRDRATQPAVQARPAIRDHRRDRLGMGPTFFGGVAPFASRRRQLARRQVAGQSSARASSAEPIRRNRAACMALIVGIG